LNRFAEIGHVGASVGSADKELGQSTSAIVRKLRTGHELTGDESRTVDVIYDLIVNNSEPVKTLYQDSLHQRGKIGRM
jgi:hypothetical protein